MKLIAKLLLMLWIKIKVLYGKRVHWIHDTDLELTFVANKIDDPSWDALKAMGIEYERYRLGDMSWDFQFDSIALFERGKGDSNSINRIAQCYFNLKDYNSYLVTYLALPLYKRMNTLDTLKFMIYQAHTTCLVNKDNIWFTADYGRLSDRGYKTIESALRAVAIQYQSKPYVYVKQDINWRFR